MHANAFGISIAESNIDSFIEKTNQLYEQVEKEPVYWVDYVWSKNEIAPQTILTIAESKNLWGQNVPEPYICIRDIALSSCQIQLMGADKGHPTLKIDLGNGVSVIRFKASQKEYEQWNKQNVLLTGICKCNKNEWNGRVSPQLILEDYSLREEWIF